ncbi:hypothetical protein QVD17_04753 [Tagetes erecta]|uniref:Uncharacterized protein n=1 Tax=Tagetes erecta TaxID=13708 RepID=A0AAD8LK55_TARER|nr:hypothetical protein QVD17_04753 [Tagetes erecta]
MSSDGADEILDKKLEGECDLEQVRSLAIIAHRCLHKTPRKRPTIGEVSQGIKKLKHRHILRSESYSTMSFGCQELLEIMGCVELQQNQLKQMTNIDETSQMRDFILQFGSGPDTTKSQHTLKVHKQQFQNTKQDMLRFKKVTFMHNHYQ